MNKAKKQIATELIAKILRMTTPVLYLHLCKLVGESKQKVINALSPEKFKTLIQYEVKKKPILTELWSEDVSIKKELLDSLSPVQLTFIGSKHLVNNCAWGQWKHLRYGHEKTHNPCRRLVNYFQVCGVERTAKILTFFINSTKGVKAGSDIFSYIEGRQFPFHVAHLLSTVHPKILFAAMNTLSPKVNKKLFWISDRMAGEGNDIVNVLLDEYTQNTNAHIYDEELDEIVNAAPVLNNELLSMFLRKNTEEMQRSITKVVGASRLGKMKAEGYSFAKIAIDPSIALTTNKVSNKDIVKDLSSNKRTVGRLSTAKTIELAGQLL